MVTLPAIKLAGLHKGLPVPSVVRSAMIVCKETGLKARLRFLPHQSLTTCTVVACCTDARLVQLLSFTVQLSKASALNVRM